MYFHWNQELKRPKPALLTGTLVKKPPKLIPMYNMTERNELRSRRSALALAIFLHLGLAALLYLSTAEKPRKSTLVSDPVKMEKSHTGAKPKVVKLP